MLPRKAHYVICLMMAMASLAADAQARKQQGERTPTAAPADDPSRASAATVTELTPRERMLLDRIEALERRLAELESRSAPRPGSPAETEAQPLAARGPAPADPAAAAQPSVDDRAILGFLKGTTINLTLDGYYSYNFNRPVGRINLLRAYDVSSNSFSLNQATVVIERAPDVQAGRRFGARLDLQYGQATETLQGNAANEPRPQAYRPIF